MNRKRFSTLLKTLSAGSLLLVSSACGTNVNISDFNPNFPNLSETGITPTASVNASDPVQVIALAPSQENELVPGSFDSAGAIGTITDQDPTHTFCVIIDPNGGNADLAVCPTETASPEVTSSDLVCPENEAVTHCSSSRGGNGPDFCSVSGARDYIFAIINRSLLEVQVAYQVINITNYPNQLCSDLNISESSIISDLL